jgi:DNA-directed RNA polymerase subunit F
MIGRKVLEEKPITTSEAKEILEKRVETGEELNYEQKTTLDHLSKFVRLAPEESRKLAEELTQKSEKIKPEVAVKIADLLPKDEEDVRAIFAKQRFTLTKEEIEEILASIPKE